jgi:hypothetical protein
MFRMVTGLSIPLSLWKIESLPASSINDLFERVVRLTIVSPGNVLEADVCETFGEIPSLLFPAIDVDSMELGLLGNPVNDDSRVTADEQMIN